MSSKIYLIGLIILIICFSALILGFFYQTGGNETLLLEINDSQRIFDGHSFNYYNITIPEGTKSVRIEYEKVYEEYGGFEGGQDLTKSTAFFVNAFNIIPEAKRDPSDYWDHQTEKKEVKIQNKQGEKGNITFRRSDIKGLIIQTRNVEGKIRIYITT